jgi:hypothetical protein
MKIRTRRSREQWLELVRQWQAAKMTAIAWCREHNISYESFIIWKNRLKTDHSQSADSQRPFVELVDAALEHSGIEIHHRSLKMTIGKNFDPEVLFRCLQVLEKF